MIKIQCDNCGKEINRQPYEIKKCKHLFCSRKCANAFRRNSLEVLCDNCGKKFSKSPSNIKRTKHNFCSGQCEKKYRTGKPDPKAYRRQVVKCDNCGKEFVKRISHIKRNKSYYCSRKCFEEAVSQGETLTCRNCNKTFYRVMSQIVKSVTPFSFCCRECYVEWYRGERHALWKGGINPYPSEFNDSLKLAVRERDKYTCQECGYTEDDLGYVLRTHHLDYCKDHNNMDNLISLCKSCHSRTNFSRSDWSKYFRMKLAGKVDDRQLLLFEV